MYARGHSNHVASAAVSDFICIPPSAPSSVGDWCRLGSGQAHQQQLWACYTVQVAVEAIACA